MHPSAEHIIILEKQTVSFECIPTPNYLEVSWNFERLQSEIFELSDFTYSLVNLNHTLTISNPRISYAGVYICQILNSQVIVNRTITLEIIPGNQNVHT